MVGRCDETFGVGYGRRPGQWAAGALAARDSPGSHSTTLAFLHDHIPTW